MMAPHLQQGRHDALGRGVRRMQRPSQSIDEACGTAGLIAVNPFVGRLSTDAVSSRQIRDVEHVALVIRDELHALIHE